MSDLNNESWAEQVRILAAIDNIRSAQKQFNKKLLIVSAIIVILFIFGPNSVPKDLFFVTFLACVLVPGLRVPGLAGLLSLFFSDNGNNYLISYFIGLLATSPNFGVAILRLYGKTKQLLSKA